MQSLILGAVPPKALRYAARLGTALTLSVVLVLGSGLGANAASVTSIDGPTTGLVSRTGSVQVAGTFAATNLLSVKVVLCRKDAAAASGCRWVNSLTAGTTSARWHGFSASIVDGNRYSLGFAGLEVGSYEARTYVLDSTTGAHGGPRDAVSFAVQSPQPASGRFSIAFGRSMWQAADTSSGVCVPLPNTPTLEDAARALAARGLYAVSGVVTSRPGTNPLMRHCEYYSTGANWADLANLRANYGWRAVSHSKTYKNMTTLTTAEQADESCGSLAVLKGHGHSDAWSLFNFPNDKQDAVSRSTVLSCFAFYRRYGSGVNDLAALESTRELSVETVDGGRCNNPALPCYSLGLGGLRYELPSALASRVLQPAADQYNLIQFYRFVDGKQGALSDAAAWDCTSADARDHWVSRVEFYCWSDFLEVLDSRSPQATVTSPAVVARELGVAPGGR